MANNTFITSVCTLLLLFATLVNPAQAGDGSLSPGNLRVEYSENPLGIDVQSPRLSWQSTSNVRGTRQTAYQIQAAASTNALTTEKLLWDSGQVTSDQSLYVIYNGPATESGDRVIWRVRVWDQNNESSEWSKPAHWEMGLLKSDDWQAKWIRGSGMYDSAEQRPATLFRKSFSLNGNIVKARLYASSRGVYELELNGKTVGDQLLAPGWTSYHHRIQYQTYDVTNLLTSGANAVGATVADGWYRGYLGWGGQRNVYGDKTALIAQLHITYADGREEIISTDTSWQTSQDGPYRAADIYNGEVYDARKVVAGWSTASYDAAAWAPATLYEGDDAKTVALVAPEGPATRAVEELRPNAISKAPNGEILVDMGQNMVGWVKLKINGKPGTEITLRHAEVLDPDGNLYTENLREAKSIDKYIVAGKGEETYEPKFTFHGFRYVGISGYSGELTQDDISGVVVHSELARTGQWESSEPLLNQLYHNIVWGQKGNFLDVPTDCPQRDERLGWTGDAQVFASTAAFNMDVSGFFAKWLKDLAHDQKPSGSVPHVIPDVLDATSHGTAGWADAATVIPWAMYRAYGDESVLDMQLPSMMAWVNYVSTQVDDDLIWRPGFQFGDWLSPQFTDVFSPYRAITGEDIIATAYFAHSADLVSRAAEVLGKKREARKYRKLFEQIRDAFQHEFLTPKGRLAYETQTAYVLALTFDLIPERLRATAAERLAADVRGRGNHLTTGFLGTPELTRVLSDNGQTDVAYDLLTQTTYPSWLYPVTFGATTIWERWDAIRTDGTFQSPEMTSFNHYAYGAIGEWMVKVVAGLDLDSTTPGYKRLWVNPKPGGGLTRASASLDTPYGPAASAWSFNGDEFTLNVAVAPNTTAQVVLPLAAGLDILESGNPLQDAEGIRNVKVENRDVWLELGSGSYNFAYRSADLLKIALDFEPFTKSTPMSDLMADPISRAAMNTLIPEFANGPEIPARMAAMPLSAMLEYAPDKSGITALIDALPDINRKRKEQLMSPQ